MYVFTQIFKCKIDLLKFLITAEIKYEFNLHFDLHEL
jgi:hypothetical protein